MVNQEIQVPEISMQKMPEYWLYDGDCFIIFYLLNVDIDNMTVDVAIENRGKLTTKDYDLFIDKDYNLCFEYGIYFQKIKIHDFE